MSAVGALPAGDDVKVVSILVLREHGITPMISTHSRLRDKLPVQSNYYEEGKQDK